MVRIGLVRARRPLAPLLLACIVGLAMQAPGAYLPLIRRPAQPTATATSTHTPRPTVTPTPRPTSTPAPPLVVGVIDGDTIDVQINGVTYRVRYIGIDTPERGACYYAEAKAQNETLVLGQRVRLERDVSETDRYGRLLRYVWIGEYFVNAALVADGYAMVYTYPPDVRYADTFLALQQEARNAGRGLWIACFTPEPTATPGSCAPCSCAGNLYNCSDFDSWYEAQVCYEHCLDVVGYDIHRLDSDDDGVACEGLR